MTTYTHSYYDVKDLKKYNVIANYPDGHSKITDPHNEVDWVKDGNIPKKISGNRFISIIDNKVILNPKMAAILVAEQVKEELDSKIKNYKDDANKKIVLIEAKKTADIDSETEVSTELQKELDNL